ncbi:hypothetical protein NC797_07200 [Aquibacillus sp. 3ASR75-11]|uniref:Uncharacterized protein n=1 Tax=Terrihalobacillus insolitus TaxID=2950438 RepID=A0A9X3WVW0_9BACI|nr:hypothetical protein [Terrihalobacillus insolitus]MDC3424294.1 hypothetical protein [Terrihalobacillus insolitus]
MTKEDILDTLSQRLGDAMYILIVLKDGPLLKEKIPEHVNEYYQQKMGEPEKEVISSRHKLDILTAKLEGAGLVNVQEVGRARMFERSKLADELSRHMKLTKK